MDAYQKLEKAMLLAIEEKILMDQLQKIQKRLDEIKQEQKNQ